jgi:hypothetical protein
MEGDFHLEVVKFKLMGKQVCRSPWQALEADWGYCAVLELYDTKDTIWTEDFHLIWWEGHVTTISSYPKMYWVSITKHVSNFCRNNMQQYYWRNRLHLSKYESCGTHDEYTMHICCYKDPSCDGQFHITVRKLYTWMVEIMGNHAVASMVEVYLLARGGTAMQSLMHGMSVDMSVICGESLLEGRISSHWLVLISPLLQCQPKNLLPFSWGKQFITRLHNIVHKQWTYRNAYIHFKEKEGWTMPQLQDIANQINEYSLMDPDLLLPCHRSLFDAKFETLGHGPTSHRLLWLADMDSAIAAFHLAKMGLLTPQASLYFLKEPPSSRLYPGYP